MMYKQILLILLVLTCFVKPSVYGSALSDVASSMPSGTWAQLKTKGFNEALLQFPGGNGHDSTEYMGKAVWDPASRQILFQGAGHYNGSQLHLYSEQANAWTKVVPSPGGGHAYYHNAINVRDGLLGVLKPSGLFINFYDIRAQTWSSSSSIHWDGGIAHALVYFPARARWYVADGTFGHIQEYDQSDDSWTVHSKRTDCFAPSNEKQKTGYYHQFAASNPIRNEVVFGGGNTSQNVSRAWCKMDSDGTITALPTAPTILGIPAGSNSGALITIDPASGDLLVLNQYGTFFAFHFSSNQWMTIDDQATRPPAFQLRADNVTKDFVVPINTYGVVLYADERTKTTWLYKHARSKTPTAAFPE